MGTRELLHGEVISSFHPWEHDTSDLLQRWKAGLAPQQARSQ